MCDRGSSNENNVIVVPTKFDSNIGVNERSEGERGHSNEHIIMVVPRSEGNGGDRVLDTVGCSGSENDSGINTAAVEVVDNDVESVRNVYSCRAPDPVLVQVEDGEVAVAVTVSEMEVQLDYEVRSVSGADVDAELVPLQLDMVAFLADGFGLGVEGCTGYDVSELSDRALRPLRRRRLEQLDDNDVTKIISISSPVSDSADPNHECLPQLDPDIPSTDCTAINGRWATSYIGTDEAAVKKAITQSLQKGMNNDQFLSANVKNVAFVGTRVAANDNTIANDNNNISDNDNNGVMSTNVMPTNVMPKANKVDAAKSTNSLAKSNNMKGVGIGLISAFAAMAVAIIALFLYKTKQRKKRAREDSQCILQETHPKNDRNFLSFDLEGLSTDSSSEEEDNANKSTLSPANIMEEQLEDNPDEQLVTNPDMSLTSTVVATQDTIHDPPPPIQQQQQDKPPTPLVESIKNKKLPVINEDGRDLLQQSLRQKEGYLQERITSIDSASSASSSKPKRKRELSQSSSLAVGIQGEVEICDEENSTEI